jgi:hypothetical protein
MSDHHEESWGEMAALSRRMARIEIALTERILALEAEVAALKGQPQADAGRAIYQDARSIEWREDGAAQAAIDVVMQR